ncbi:hypothetical protein CRUP_021884 [Coryphaenoides rupestris]|nr:hypothetical protein CRUP_021884 [Coryphaenoides rupestris]
MAYGSMSLGLDNLMATTTAGSCRNYPATGLDAELYYVRDNVVSHFALSFIMPVPSDTNHLHFTWYSKTKVDYRLGFQVENPAAMNQPKSNISTVGEVPRVVSGESATGYESLDGFQMLIAVRLLMASNFTVLNFKRRKICNKRTLAPSPRDRKGSKQSDLTPS